VCSLWFMMSYFLVSILIFIVPGILALVRKEVLLLFSRLRVGFVRSVARGHSYYVGN